MNEFLFALQTLEAVVNFRGLQSNKSLDEEEKFEIKLEFKEFYFLALV